MTCEKRMYTRSVWWCGDRSVTVCWLTRLDEEKENVLPPQFSK